MINISIVGYGTMGKILEAQAKKEGFQVISIVDPFDPQASHREISLDSMRGVDTCICFTRPDVALENIKDICRHNKSIIMATTGWLESLPQVRKWIDEAGNAFVYSSNFSLGVNIFFQIVNEAAKVMDSFIQYDVLGHEFHHNRKLDSPSGTAKTIGGLLIQNIQRKDKLVTERLDRQIESNELQFSSVRGGDIPGTHLVQFESSFDSIELKHTARNRKGFAIGALLAAKWVQEKKGMFTEQDIISALLSGNEIH